MQNKNNNNIIPIFHDDIPPVVGSSLNELMNLRKRKPIEYKDDLLNEEDGEKKSKKNKNKKDKNDEYDNHADNQKDNEEEEAYTGYDEDDEEIVNIYRMYIKEEANLKRRKRSGKEVILAEMICIKQRRKNTVVSLQYQEIQ
jgi:hypothetical protein